MVSCTLKCCPACIQVGLFQSCFVLGIEIVGQSKRVFCAIVIEFFFVGGELLLALVAWWLRFETPLI